ncbi:hypothetical protein ILYODFUR_020073 [Ilyodon furcidens]|uniref:ethanolamine kinase n=1 Tax=Ilyodon furcidens TaxID=33524 RepID=A0ABV0T9K8_9TELE
MNVVFRRVGKRKGRGSTGRGCTCRGGLQLSSHPLCGEGETDRGRGGGGCRKVKEAAAAAWFRERESTVEVRDGRGEKEKTGDLAGCTSSSSVALREVPSYETLMVEMESLKIHLSQTDSPTVLCHNDLLTKNIIYNSFEGTVKFIDYEYADYNYQAFDIGNHFNEFAGVTDVDYSLYPSRELQRDWLTAYLESYKHSTGREATVTDAEVTQLYIQVCKFSLASNFFWGLWAILQSRYSSIDFDFQRFVHMVKVPHC